MAAASAEWREQFSCAGSSLMKKLPHILLALAVSAAAAALLSTLLGRILFLSSRAEVVKLGVILFAVSSAVWITLILAIRRKD
jgi:hypothetical protein